MHVPPDALRLLDNAIREDFQTLRDSYFAGLLVFTGIVAVGVVLEETDLLPIRKIRSRTLNGYPLVRYKLIRLLKAVERIGWVLVVIGVIGEGVFEGYTSKADGLLQTLSDALVSESQRAAATANERAVNAEVLAKGYEAQIADSNARVKTAEAKVAAANAASHEAVAKVAEASAKAESFRLDIAKANEAAKQAEARAVEAQLALERFKADRTLSDEQQKRIVLKLKPFAGQKFAFAVYPNPESLKFLKLIADVLKSSLWERIDPQIGSVNVEAAGGLAGEAFDAGISAFTAPDDTAARPALTAFASAVSAEGHPCAAHFTAQLTGKTPKAITIMIGAKE
jgi:hypothetical protein